MESNITENVILYDWVSFTSKKHTPEQLIAALGLSHCPWTETKGARGYRDRKYFSCISVHYNGRDDMGVWVEMSGQGCRTFESMSKVGWDNLFKFIHENDLNMTRLDVAYDFDIFDESTMTIHNPASGDIWTATAWEYDYETRSYYCTLEDDQYVRITFGDAYVTIIYPDDNGTYHEQHYYYVTAEFSASDSCDHVYTSETTTLPTCTENGWRTYTCELCGYSYQSSVPAAGHTWEATETVETEYNDNGDVVKLGYTVYTCSACGETYKAYAQDGQPAEPPSPGGSSGSSSSGGGIWDSIKETVSSAIKAVVETAMKVITTVIEKTLSLATDMLSFFFDFLSDTVTSGVKNFFSSFSDSSILDIFQQENEDGSTTTTLPEGMPGAMATVGGFITGLPSELLGVLVFGIALLLLLAALKLLL